MPVANSAAAEQFYCKQLGFRREFAHRPQGVTQVHATRLHLSSCSGDGVSGSVVNLIVVDVVVDVDALHKKLAGKSVRIDTGELRAQRREGPESS